MEPRATAVIQTEFPKETTAPASSSATSAMTAFRYSKILFLKKPRPTSENGCTPFTFSSTARKESQAYSFKGK